MYHWALAKDSAVLYARIFVVVPGTHLYNSLLDSHQIKYFHMFACTKNPWLVRHDSTLRLFFFISCTFIRFSPEI